MRDILLGIFILTLGISSYFAWKKTGKKDELTLAVMASMLFFIKVWNVLDYNVLHSSSEATTIIGSIFFVLGAVFILILLKMGIRELLKLGKNRGD